MEGLSALFGKDGVRETTNVVLTQVPTLIETRTKFGGVPGFLQATSWPRCSSCKDPMMFVGQVAMGPDQPLDYPTDAILYMFLCQSDPRDEPMCESWSPESGCSSVFAQHGSGDRQAPNESFISMSRVAELVADSCADPDEAHTMWVRAKQRGNREYLATLVGQYRCAFRTELSVCDQQIEGTERAAARYAAMEALGKERAVFLGGFPDWVQEPSAPTCECGKAMEFALQFTGFDELNLGDAGEAYVFACPDRCSPTSFALEWQCC
jgi:hypothetical protein